MCFGWVILIAGISTTAAYALNAEHYLKLMQSAVPQAQAAGDARGSEAMTDRASRCEAGSANSVLSTYHMVEAVWRNPEEAERMRRSAEIEKANGGSGIFYQMRLDEDSIASASVARFFQTSATV